MQSTNGHALVWKALDDGVTFGVSSEDTKATVSLADQHGSCKQTPKSRIVLVSHLLYGEEFERELSPVEDLPSGLVALEGNSSRGSFVSRILERFGVYLAVIAVLAGVFCYFRWRREHRAALSQEEQERSREAYEQEVALMQAEDAAHREALQAFNETTIARPVAPPPKVRVRIAVEPLPVLASMLLWCHACTYLGYIPKLVN